MPKFPSWQTTRKALTLTAMAAMVTGGALLTTGSASAGTLTTDTCSGSLTGRTGDQVAVPGKAFSDIVKTAAKTREIFLHLNGVDPDALAKAIADRGTLTIGTIAQTSATSIAGDMFASVVTQSLQNESGLGLPSTKTETLDAIRAAVTKSCGITAVASNYVAPANPRGDAPGASGRPGVGTGTALAPPRDHDGSPSTTAGGFAIPPGINYPGDGPLPGQQSPEFGLLGAGADTGQPTQPGQPADVRNAGNADTLASPVSADDVQLPILVAVIALAGVTAALVRTWVLRRAA